MDNTQITRSAIPQISAATQRVIDLFRSLQPDEEVSYATINAAAGCDVRRKRNIVSTAIRRVLTDDSIHVACVWGKGYKRLNNSDAAKAVDSDMSRSRKAARRGLKKAQRVDLLALPKDEQIKHVMRTSLCSIVSESLGNRGRAKIEAVASAQPENTAVLAQKMALEALKSGE